MDKFKMLSGEQLVALGAKKGSCTLPEIGLKDVVPNGSWLEQKQVQTSLEARRHIVEVERIEKCGTLSQAEWNEKLNLAEVSKNAGGHWQYVGHNIGRNLYLQPEEALHLMEINCLQLTHNGVTVSIQQAYSLLLKDSLSLAQYKVYASLSRLGYKVLRHTYVKSEDTEDIETTNKVEHPSSSDQACESNINEEEIKNSSMEVDDSFTSEKGVTSDCQSNNISNDEKAVTTKDSNRMNEDSDKRVESNIDTKTEVNIVSVKDTIKITQNIDEQNAVANDKENCKLDDVNVQMEIENFDETVEVSSSVILCDDEDNESNELTVEVSEGMSNKGSIAIIQNKIDILSCRESKPRNSDLIHQCFNENIPDFYQKHIVTVKAPEEQHIPRNVFLNNTAYVLNLQNLKLKSVTPVPSSSTGTYSASEEANAQHVRRIRSGYSNESAQTHFTPQFFPNMRFPQQTHNYRQFNYWNQFNYNWPYQRPYFPMPFRFQVFPRMQQMYRFFPTPTMSPNNANHDPRRPRKRKRNNPRKYHLESIKRLAFKLKGLVASGNRQEENIQALQRLIQTYNIRYKAKLELTDQLDVLENEVILETIDLDEDETNSKKKKHEDLNLYDENFNSLKQFSARIKELNAKNLLSARHRRAFSNVIRTFNKSYNADIYVDANFEVIDRRRIVIASSSDSECAIEETQSTVDEGTSDRRRNMKLRNPFSIMKQLSEKQNSTHDTNESSPIHSKKKFEYSNHLKSRFSKYWLPSEDDFGRAEVPLKNDIKQQIEYSEDFLYQFIASQRAQFKNWLDAKIAYWQSCKETALKFEAQSQNENKINLNCIISLEDCADLRTVLKKLSVIKTNKDLQEECSLSLHFDVYQRDVPNFRKTQKPKPHFRVICIEETSSFPTGIELATLHSKYTDDVGIVFAIVGISSITYLQMNPMDLPIYVPSTNLP